MTALHVAVEKGYSEVCLALLKDERFTAVNAVDKNKSTALHVAAYGYDHENLLMLLVRDGGAGVDTPDSLGRTALHYAADTQDQIAGFVNVFAEPPPDTMPILAQRTLSAVRMAADLTQSAAVAELSVAQLETVKTLLVFGADARAQSAHTGSTPLHLAARSGATEVVRLLIRHGAALEARNSHGDTALITAATPSACGEEGGRG